MFYFFCIACLYSTYIIISVLCNFLQNSLDIFEQIGGGNAPSSGASGGNGLTGLTNILSQIDLPGLLRGVNSFVKLVGVFCPPLSQVIMKILYFKIRFDI